MALHWQVTLEQQNTNNITSVNSLKKQEGTTVWFSTNSDKVPLKLVCQLETGQFCERQILIQ